MSTHTPGPWTLYDARKDGSTSFYVNHGPDYIGSVHLAPGRAAVGSSNARLIASAPELLEALSKATDALAGGLWDHGPGQDEHDRCEVVVEECRAVISKATGEGA